MTRVRTGLIRILTLLTVVSLLTAVFSELPRVKVRAEGDIGITINSLSLQLVSGAELDDDIYYWRPITSSAGHSILFRVLYSFSGQGMIPARGVRFRLPRRLIKDRNERYADTIDLSVPHLNDATSVNDFGYYRSGSDIIVTNVRPFSAAENGYFEFSYETTRKTFEYRDMSMTDECTASLTITRGEKSVSADSDPVAVCIDTAAAVSSSRKSYPDTFYQKWKSEWGQKPEHADDYYYLEWLVCSYINATQPYVFSLIEDFDEEDAGVVGYCFEGQDTYKRGNSISGQTRSGYRIDKVLTYHSKETYEPLEQYTLENSVHSVVLPSDSPDDESEALASSKFIYDTPVFVYPHENWNSWMYGTTSWKEHFNYEWNVADYRLQEFKEGQIPYIDGNLRYCVYTVGMPYARTLEEHADPDDYLNYGKRSVTYTVTSDKFYFMDDITTDSEVITIPEGNVPVTSQDYEIEYLTYDIKLNGARYDEEKKRFVMIGATFGEDDVIYFDAKFDDNDQWIENVAVCRLLNGDVSINEDYVTSASSRSVNFRENCTGYRVRYSNPYFRTRMHVYPYCKLKSSPLVMERMGDEQNVWLTSTGHFSSVDYKGVLCYDKDIIARDYIAGFQKDAKITKTVTGMENDKTTQSVTVNWKASVMEEYITSDGMKYVQQKSGIFYDLMPLGNEPVVDSVAILSGDDYLPVSEYTVTTETNFRNTGRTLMTVSINVPFETASLTYSSVYTWDAIIDYGYLLLNSIAYETGNDTIANGFHDNGGELFEADLMAALDEDCEDDRFQYAEHKVAVNVARSATFGLTKRVKAEGDAYYTDFATVMQNGSYSYRLRYATEMEKFSSDIIIYDSLENYTEDGIQSDFHGTLQSVDVSQMDRLMASPVVYYSDMEDLDLSTAPDLDEVRDNKRVWQTQEDFGDISRARAIAIDIRKNVHGEDFVLGPTQSVVAIINMKAPPEDTSGSADPKAYNEVYVSDSIVEEGADIADYYIHHGYTTVNLRIMADVDLLKVSSADLETPVKNVVFTLEGVSDYGTDVSDVSYSDASGRISFKDVEKGTYTLTEISGSDDYQRIYGSKTVTVDEAGKVWIDGMPVDDTGIITITDEPRAHANVYFYKRDFTGTGRLINGARFELTGQSAYGNDMTAYAVSDGGRVVFYNIEKGTYRMVETSPAENYLPNSTVYKVTVDEGGEFFIAIDKTQEGYDEQTLVKNDSGVYMIFNERFHSFTIVKQGLNFKMPIPGAVFELKGVSDYGRSCEKTGTTVSSGALTFNGLEAGVYTLTETFVPEGYQLDSTSYAVEIDKFGRVTIEGLQKDDQGAFIVPNKEEGTITVVKKWLDNDSSGRYTEQEETQDDTQDNTGSGPRDEITDGGNDKARRNVEPLTGGSDDQDFGKADSLISTAVAARSAGQTRAPDSESAELVPKLPNIVVSSDVPIPYAFFDGGGGQSILQQVTPLENIKSFAPFDGSDTEFQGKITAGQTVRIDDHSTGYHIYAWYDSTTGGVYWWSDARKVYLTDDSHYIWCGLTNCTSIDASGIDTSLLTDMSRMFYTDGKLSVLDIGEFDTSHVTTMSDMFRGCSKLEQVNVVHFNMERVTDMSYMFMDCTLLRNIDLSGFHTPRLETLYSTFRNCSSLESIDLTCLDTSNLNSMYLTLGGCAKLENVSLANMDLSKVTTMQGLFNKCSNLKTVDLSHTNTVSLEDMYGMFYTCPMLRSVDFTGFVTSNVTTMRSCFYNCSSLEHLDLSSFDTSKVTLMNHMFFGCAALQELDVTSFDTSNVTTMKSMFNQCGMLEELDLTHFNTSKVTDMGHLVYRCTSLKRLDLSSFDTSNVTLMNQMFDHATSLEWVDVSSFDTSNVTNMLLMFGYTDIRNLDLSNFDTSNVTTMCEMFEKSSSIETLDLSSFNTSKCTDTSWMFNYCSSLRELDLSSFDTSNVETMYCMFQCCTSLESLNVSSFYTPKNKYTRGMFSFCSRLTELDISGFVMKNVVDAQGMFKMSTGYQTIYVSELWDMDDVPAGQDNSIMFYNTPSIEGQAGTRYSGSHTDGSYAHIDDADNPGYFTYRAAHYKEPEVIMNNYSYFGAGENDTSVFSRVCDLSQIAAFRHFEGTEADVNALIEEDAAVRVDDGTEQNPPIYAWLEDDGVLQWWSSAKTVYLSNQAHCLFRGLTGCTGIDTEGINSTPLTDGSHLFEDCHALTDLSLSKLNLSNLVNSSYMFSGCSSITDFNWVNFNPSALINISYMFSGCSSLTHLSYSWSISKATDMSGLYSGCVNLEEIDTPIFTPTAALDMSCMFKDCKKLTTVNLSRFRAPSVTDLSYMFDGCESLTDLNTRTFITSNVTNMHAMFRNCKSIVTFNINGFDLTNTTDMAEMFSGCTSMTVLDVSRLTPDDVTDMSCMFADCENLATIYASDLWSTDNLQVSEDMFRGCAVLVGGNGTSFDPDYTDGVRAILDLEGQKGYLAEKGSKNNTMTYTPQSDNCEVRILDDDTWEFTFTGLDPNIPYYVWEEDYEGYTTSTPKDNYSVVLNEVITIVNTSKTDPPPEPTYGSLSVSKLLAGDGLTDEDMTRSFLFTVTLTDENDAPLTGNKVFDGTAFRDGTAQVRLCGGETKAINGIPAGYHYTVTEAECDGFVPSEDSFSGAVEADNTSEIVFTNTKQFTQEDNVSFTLKKTVEGNFEHDTGLYDFIVSFTGLRREETYSLSNGQSFTAGSTGRAEVRLSLGNGDEVSFMNIPVGSAYRVTEAAGDYLPAFTVADAAGLNLISQSNGLQTEKNTSLSTAQETADKGENILITFNNTLDLRQSLRIGKRLENIDSGNSEKFRFVLEASGLSAQESVRTDSIGRFRADGAGRLHAEFYLSGGQEVVFYDLPVGLEYQVTELANDYKASYVVSDSKGGSKIVKASDQNSDTNTDLSTAKETVNQDEEATVTFSNTKVQHDVSVTKQLDYNTLGALPTGYNDLQFTFTAVFSGLEPSADYSVTYTEQGTTGIVTESDFSSDDEGRAEFEFLLMHGQTCTFKNLPVSAAYTVTERADRLFRPSFVIRGNSGAVIRQASGESADPNRELSTASETVEENDLDVRIIYTNTFDVSDFVLPDAGTDDHRNLVCVMLVGVMLFGTIFVLSRKRYGRDKSGLYR